VAESLGCRQDCLTVSGVLTHYGSQFVASGPDSGFWAGSVTQPAFFL